MKYSHLTKGAACALALSVSVSAQVLMLDFGPTPAAGASLTSSPYHSVNGSTGSFWNKIELADKSAGSLSWSTATEPGNATGVSVNLGATTTNGSTLINLANNPTRNLALGNPVNTGVYAGSSVATDAIFSGASKTDHLAAGIQVGGLAAGTYDIYITARNTNTSAIQKQRLYAAATAGASTFDFSGYIQKTLSFTSTQSASWMENSNYVVLSVTLAANQVLNIASLGLVGDGDEARGFLNSIQIVNTTAIPEPSAFAFLAGLLGLGAAACTRRRRHA